MNAIVAVCQDWGIGHEGSLLVRNREDMESFVRHTKGGTVIMGRNTLESFPGGRPLRDRRNIVLTRNPDYAPEGVEPVHSVAEAIEAVANEDPETVYVIGGASVYRQMLPHCERVFVTKNGCLRPADAFFPNLDEDPAWVIEDLSDEGETDEGIPFVFVTYRRA